VGELATRLALTEAERAELAPAPTAGRRERLGIARRSGSLPLPAAGGDLHPPGMSSRADRLAAAAIVRPAEPRTRPIPRLAN
jgi:hypothetical protein